MSRALPELRSPAGFSCALALALLGCSDPPVVTAPSVPESKSAAPAASGAASAAGSAGAAGAAPKLEVQENEFAESERSRDPFRSFANTFVTEKSTGHGHPQHEVILHQYSLDELKLIGIVTRAEPAKAMLVDPTGKGYVIKRGQFVGRADVVQGAGTSGNVYEINWRVERIRPGDVVLVREDPANPDVPTATRVIALRPEEQPVTKN